MKILVTGGTGFIGSHVVRELVKRGHEPVTFNRMPNPSLISDVIKYVKVLSGDIRDLSHLLKVIKSEKIEIIVHAASLLTAASQKRPLDALQINLTGTVNVLEAAKLMNVKRVVYISSTAVYGITEEGIPIKEDHPLKPVTIYGITKLASEYFGINYSKDYGLEFIALRLPIVYGPGQSYRGFSALKEIIEKPVKGKKAVVPKGGDQKYDIIYVKDVAKAISLSCEIPKIKCEIINIGSGKFYSLKEVADIVKKYIPDAIIKIGPGFDISEPIRGPLDITKAKKLLGFLPEFSLEDGIKDYIKIIRSSLK